MRRRQLNSLRMFFVVLSFLLFFEATVAFLTLPAVEQRQLTQPQLLVPRSVRQQQPHAGRQYDARRSLSFNALLASVGQLTDSPFRRHGWRLPLTQSNASSRKRLARAADDGIDDGATEAPLSFLGGNSDGEGGMEGVEGVEGGMFQSVIQFIMNNIGAILKLFAASSGDGDAKQ